MKWSILSGDVNWETYGGKLVAGPFDNGDFQYWFVMEVIEWEECLGEMELPDVGGTHNVCLSVVAPSECPADEWQGIIDSYGWEGMEIDSPLTLVDMLHDCGIRAVIWDSNGNLKDLLREGKQAARVSECFTFGIDMDHPQNAIGATGWDLLRGDPMAGLHSTEV
jgi:hypothetical protein